MSHRTIAAITGRNYRRDHVDWREPVVGLYPRILLDTIEPQLSALAGGGQ